MKDRWLEGHQDRHDQQGRRVRLDWSRMLGFDQLEGTRAHREAPGPIGARAGIKPGGAPITVSNRIGSRIGAKPGFKPITIGARIGAKPGFKPMP